LCTQAKITRSIYDPWFVCGMTTWSAVRGRAGTSQRKSAVAATPPTICATMNAGASLGRMPANVSVIARAIVTAGFAKDVDAVNQYARR
jgi:hypothetical protein